MTHKNNFKNSIKVASTEIDQIHQLLVKLSFSLEEIRNYDDGRYFQTWSNPDTKQTVELDIETEKKADISDVVTELVDCWHELREIKNALIDDDLCLLNSETPSSPHEQLMLKMRLWEQELEEEKDSLSIIFSDNVDPALLGFYDLDEETREALLN